MTNHSTSEISITEASKTWGVSRNTIYTKIREGSLSRLPSKKIDTAEMIRVFGEPEQKSTKEYKKNSTTENVSVHENLYSKIALLEQELQIRKEQLEEAKNRADRAEEQGEKLLQSVTELTTTIKLLEAPKKEIKKGFWGFFRK